MRTRRWRREQRRERRITKELTGETHISRERTKVQEVWRKENQRWLHHERRKKKEKKRDRHFKKTDLFIHQWTIKLIACHHANGQDPARFSTPLATKTVVSTFSLFPYALFSRVRESFKSFPERKNIKKFVPNVCRRASWVIVTGASRVIIRATECNIADASSTKKPNERGRAGRCFNLKTIKVMQAHSLR